MLEKEGSSKRCCGGKIEIEFSANKGSGEHLQLNKVCVLSAHWQTLAQLSTLQIKTKGRDQMLTKCEVAQFLTPTLQLRQHMLLTLQLGSKTRLQPHEPKSHNFTTSTQFSAASTHRHIHISQTSIHTTNHQQQQQGNRTGMFYALTSENLPWIHQQFKGNCPRNQQTKAHIPAQRQPTVEGRKKGVEHRWKADCGRGKEGMWGCGERERMGGRG